MLKRSLSEILENNVKIISIIRMILMMDRYFIVVKIFQSKNKKLVKTISVNLISFFNIDSIKFWTDGSALLTFNFNIDSASLESILGLNTSDGYETIPTGQVSLELRLPPRP